MAQALDPRYASPGLRWGLLLEDHPGARYAFDLKVGTDLAIPQQFGGDSMFCVATIEFPKREGEAQREAVVAWKPCPQKGTPDEWNVLCTKTLGRALKKAGYPDNLNDLKALVLWRQREAEIQAITSGHAQPVAALGPAPGNDADLDAAGTADPEHVGADDDHNEPPGDPSEDPAMRLPEAATLDTLRAAIGGLPRDVQPTVTAWARNNGMKVTKPQTEAEAQAILAHVRGLSEPAPSDDDTAEPCGYCSEDPCICAPDDEEAAA